jgi:AcrR family transcriptional regulator
MYTLRVTPSDVNVDIQMAATRNRDSYHHGDLRRILIAFALRRVRSGGADGFSLREAARAAGVTAGAVYRHFDDREALLAAVAVEGFRLLAVRTMRATTGAAGIHRLLATGRAYVAFASAEPRLFRLMFSQVGTRARQEYVEMPDAPSSFEQMRAALVEVAGVEAGADEAVLAHAWSVAHGAASLICDGVWMRNDPRAEAALQGFVKLAASWRQETKKRPTAHRN